MRTIRNFVAHFVIILALFGAVSSVINSAVCFMNESSVDRNPGFFVSQEKLTNDLLCLPRWINKVYPDDIIYGLGTNDYYGIVNQVVGLGCVIILIGAIIQATELFSRKQFGAEFCLSCFSWIYIFYWGFASLWLVHQWTNGISLIMRL